jgi:hypothetical protein
VSKGAKTGGRKPGTPNKLTEAVTDLLNGLTAQGLACDPIEFLARMVANDAAWFGRKTSIPMALRLKAALELAPYRAPKRKAIEITSAGGVSPVMIISDKKPNQSWQDRAAEVREAQQKQLQEVTK